MKLKKVDSLIHSTDPVCWRSFSCCAWAPYTKFRVSMPRASVPKIFICVFFFLLFYASKIWSRFEDMWNMVHCHEADKVIPRVWQVNTHPSHSSGDLNPGNFTVCGEIGGGKWVYNWKVWALSVKKKSDIVFKNSKSYKTEDSLAIKALVSWSGTLGLLSRMQMVEEQNPASCPLTSARKP